MSWQKWALVSMEVLVAVSAVLRVGKEPSKRVMTGEMALGVILIQAFIIALVVTA